MQTHQREKESERERERRNTRKETEIWKYGERAVVKRERGGEIGRYRYRDIEILRYREREREKEREREREREKERGGWREGHRFNCMTPYLYSYQFYVFFPKAEAYKLFCHKHRLIGVLVQHI